MAAKFTMKFTMVCIGTGQPVYYKQDGQRFGQAQTLKLNVNTDYELRFTTKPGVHFNNLMIDGESYKLEHIPNKDIDPNERLSYKAKYSTTEVCGTKNRHRKWILLSLEMENEMTLSFTIQCKVYKAGETYHAQWGQKLNALDIDCTTENDKTSVTVLREIIS